MFFSFIRVWGQTFHTKLLRTVFSVTFQKAGLFVTIQVRRNMPGFWV